jgi:protein-L-isoaspartate(D-aspartate) O-methyltransferase
MVEEQLRPRGIHARVVLEAMGAVAREEFLPPARRAHAYDDGALAIGEGQTISQPFMVAVMTQLVLSPEVEAGGRFGRVLEVGAGSGYQAAVLAALAKEVVTIERLPALAERARATLARVGATNVEVVVGDGTLGLPDKAPFDAILVAAGAPRVPDPLVDQLAVGGRLVVPVGDRWVQELAVVTRDGDSRREERSTRCVFVPLIGAEGWADEVVHRW